MKKLGTLALTLALTGAMGLPALAAEDAPMVIAPSPNAYSTAITLNSKALDTAAIPSASDAMLPLRLLAEADHGSAYWDQEGNESWFTFGDDRIIVKFADNSIWLNDEQVKSQAEVTAGVTFVPASVLELMEGFTVTWADPTAEGFRSVVITTPNNDPLVKAAYTITEEAGMGYSMRMDGAAMAEAYQLPADSFEQVIGFFPMITSPDTLVIGKLAEGADVTAVKDALEAYRQSQEDTFSWYLSQNLPKVQDARLLVEDGYVLFLIAEDADAGETAFRAFVDSL